MRLVFLLVLLIGIGLAGFAGVMTLGAFGDQGSQIRNLKKQLNNARANQVKTKNVIVMSKSARYGTRLSKDYVKVVKFPEGAVPPNAFTSLEQVFGKPNENKPPRLVLRTMDTFDTLTRAKVTNFGEDAGLVSQLEKGIRAFTLRVNVSSAVAGFLRPGDKVDVLWTGNLGGGTITRQILNGVQLLAIDQISDQDRDKPTIVGTITVGVSPEVVARLVQAQATGRLTLSLRGIEDDVDPTEETIQVNTQDALGIERAAPSAPKPKRKVCTVRSRKGGEVTTIEIPCPKE